MSQSNSSFSNDEFMSREDLNPNLKPKTRCLGCLGDQPNQLAHMDPPHGCLFEPNDN